MPTTLDSAPRAGWIQTRIAWTAVAGLLCGALYAFQPQGDPGGDPGQTEAFPTTSFAGSSADSNNRMVAVTGLDITGQSVLYLVDTVNMSLAVYQASGGSSSTQGIRLVGARNISLDLELDGFNDKTESKGRPMGFKDLEEQFRKNGLLPE
ncbi:MAG: hypothetical protein ACI8QZ_002795 [Chlamydiales bacterium]|jgi:hypothetical protein